MVTQCPLRDHSLGEMSDCQVNRKRHTKMNASADGGNKGCKGQREQTPCRRDLGDPLESFVKCVDVTWQLLQKLLCYHKYSLYSRYPPLSGLPTHIIKCLGRLLKVSRGRIVTGITDWIRPSS